MSKIPRVVLAAGLGVGTFLAVDSAIERDPRSAYATEQLNTCVTALGEQAVSAVALNEACSEYSNSFVPASVGSGSQTNRTLTFKLPSPVELLKAEGGEAALIDQNIFQANANARSEELAISTLAGVAVAFAFGSLKPVKKLDKISLRSQKKSSRKVPHIS